MQGSIAITPSPVIMENLVFRQKIGLSFSTNSLLPMDRSNTCHSTARCLFGPPDPKQAKELVKEVELKSAFNFGKRFNFDIVSGEPFPSAKRIKLSHPMTEEDMPEANDSDVENVAMADEDESDGYIWSETYDEEYMSMCNKHAVNASILGPNRHPVSLLFAPIIPHRQSHPSPSSSPKENIASVPLSESSMIPSTSSLIPEASPTPLNSPSNNTSLVQERNNNVQKKSSTEKRSNRLNRVCHPLNHHSAPPSGKKTSLSKISKYTNRVVKQAVKKHKNTIITDYLTMRRMKSEQVGVGKKH